MRYKYTSTKMRYNYTSTKRSYSTSILWNTMQQEKGTIINAHNIDESQRHYAKSKNNNNNLKGYLQHDFSSDI